MGTLNSPTSRVVKDSTPSRRQICDAISTSNLEVFKFQDWWIFTYFIFGHGESSPNDIWGMVNLEQTCVLLFSLFESESWPRRNKPASWIFTQLYLSRRWILTQLFWKRGELMVNPDLTILLKRWRLEVGRFKMPFDTCISDQGTFTPVGARGFHGIP